MSKGQIIIVLIYTVGFFASYSMLRIEHESEGKVYTKLDRLISIALSTLSFLAVLLILWSTWFKKISETGYWNTPVKKGVK
jgi:hypothetical protein